MPYYYAVVCNQDAEKLLAIDLFIVGKMISAAYCEMRDGCRMYRIDEKEIDKMPIGLDEDDRQRHIVSYNNGQTGWGLYKGNAADEDCAMMMAKDPEHIWEKVLTL